MCDKDRGPVAYVFGLVLSLSLALSSAACGSKAPEVVAGKMPEGGNFTGVYFSPQYGEMNVVQNGSAVIGTQ